MAANSLFLLSDIADQVCLNIGAVDNITQAQARKWVNRALLRFSEMGYWSFQRVYGYEFLTTANIEEYAVPNIVKFLSIYLHNPIQRRLTLIEDREFRALYPYNNATGTPYYWRRMGWEKDAIDTQKIGLYPIPDGVYSVRYDAIAPIVLFANDEEDARLINGMPSNMTDLLIEMATAIGYKKIDDSLASSQMQECMERLNAFYGKDQSEINDVFVRRPIDCEYDFYKDPTLPPQYSDW